VIFSLLLAASDVAGQRSIEAVQIDVTSLLNDRVVITAKDGVLQPALHSTDTWADSVLITQSAAELAHSGEMTALPESDLFAANDHHPAVKLHYAQADGGAQVHRSAARSETYSFAVPGQRYSQLQLFFISAQGETPIEVHLYYADDAVGKRYATAPDFFNLPKNSDPRWFVLTGDFGKVNMQGKKMEAAHHYLHGFDLNPDPTKKLLKVEIVKLDSSSVLNFFGATGRTAHSGGAKKRAHQAIFR
jgi:hypothetical protein